MDPKDPATPGETPAPPAAPAAPAATPEPNAPETPPATPPGSEPDTNSGEEPATVPSSRLREETEKRRKAEEEATRLQAELDQRSNPTPPQNPDDELDPEVEDLIRKGAKKLGLVSKEELDANELNRQVQQDVQDLTAAPPNAGIPYDHKEVLKFAEENNLPITSKAALRATYRELNYDKIVEAERAKAIDGYKTGEGNGAERPGSGGPTPPAEPEITGKSTKERTRERIRLARQKLA